MPHLYTYNYAHAELCIASGNEQTVAFTAAGCSGYDPCRCRWKSAWDGEGRISYAIFKKYVFFLLRILFSVAEGWHLCFIRPCMNAVLAAS